MSEQIKAKPITFTAAMIPRILDGSKTQSRRVISPQPPEGTEWDEASGLFVVKGSRLGVMRNSRYGPVGQRLYVQESFRVNSRKVSSLRIEAGRLAEVQYKSDNTVAKVIIPGTHFDKPTSQPTGKWHSGRFMPQWASRIMLERIGARVERLQDISDSDASGEGLQDISDSDASGEGCQPCEYTSDHFASKIFGGCPCQHNCAKHVCSFADLWDSINEKRGHGWDANDWVDVVEFKVIESLAKSG